MRLISSFRDYYDGLCTFDKDDKPVYLRETRELSRDEVPTFPGDLSLMPMPPYMAYSWHPGACHLFCLAICGRSFLGYRSPWKVYWSVAEVFQDVEALVYIPHDGAYASQVVNAQENREMRDRYRAQLHETRWTRKKLTTHAGAFRFSAAGWDAFVAQRDTHVPDSAFLAADAPVLYWTGLPQRAGIVVANPNLNELQLSGVMEVNTLVQEIEMFLGSQLAKQEDPDSARTNVGVIHAHGFGEESFRNRAPNERKARRRAKKNNISSGA